MITAASIEDAAGNELSLLDWNHRLGTFQGLHGIPPARRITRPRPGQHGQIDETRHYGSRQPVWEGQLVGADVDELWADYDELMAALWGMVGDSRLLRWTRDDGTELQSAVKLADAFDPVLQVHSDSREFLAYQLIFDREDPRNYAQALTTATGDPLTSATGGLTFDAPFNWTFTPSGAGEVTVTNSGNIESPAVFRIYGECSSPQILLTDSTKRIVFSGEVSAGDYLEVDIRARSASLNGTADRTNLVVFEETDWTTGEIPVGSSTFRLVAGSFDASARLDVIHRPAWA